MNAVMGNLAAAVEFIKGLFELVKSFFAELLTAIG